MKAMSACSALVMRMPNAPGESLGASLKGKGSAVNWIDFVHTLTWEMLPAAVQQQAKRCLLDTLGTAVAARNTNLSQIVHDFAAVTFGGSEAALWQDGRFVSAPGAALANGMTIDALDIHDGYTQAKGHAGAAIVPALIAAVEQIGADTIDGKSLLTTLVVGYEIALRASVALHSTACDYHTSGAWNALGCAAMVARLLALDATQTRHALGIAEYHGPRSQMMRCIDSPTMLKDGSGWGAMAGVSAALLAARGFTGAPAVTVAGDNVAELWSDLGQRWLILAQYFKPHAVCRWAQPAITAALALRQQHNLQVDQIAQIEVRTFHEAVCLHGYRPQTTEEAQYSLPFPVAAALVNGRLGPDELSGPALQETAVLQLADKIKLIEEDIYSAQFPGKRYARLHVTTHSGTTYDSGRTEATWEADAPPTDAELKQKFRWLAGTHWQQTRVDALSTFIWSCESQPSATPLVTTLHAP